MAGKDLPKWSDVKPLLREKPPEEVFRLLQDLFNLSTENKALIAARLWVAQGREGILDEYRERITRQFEPKRGLPNLDLRAARKAISDYKKTTNDPLGVIELMLTYLESGLTVTEQYGDIDEPYYNSLESVLESLVKLLKGARNAELYYTHEDRLRALRSRTHDLGWGIGDVFDDEISELAEFYKDQ
jgi:hypothetical protein